MTPPVLVQTVLDVRTGKSYTTTREAREDGARGLDLLGVVGSSVALDVVLKVLIEANAVKETA